MAKRRTDTELAEEVAAVMRADYWFNFTRTALANRVRCDPVRLKRVLESDDRFRSVVGEGQRHEKARWRLWS